jgi:peptidoglycan/xylan/chitin deacetylase (PgdA/CDA1 family)
VETYLRYPSIADMILKAGHEIALHGLSHRGCSELGQKFLMEVKEAKRLLEEHVGPIYGFRAPNGDIDSMGLQTLQRFGFKYDSSIVPCHTIPGWYGNPSSPVGPYRLGSSGIVEFPLATHPTWRLPAHGGWFLRNFGLSYIKWAIRALLKKSDIAVLYIHPWEVSNYNPRHVEIPFHVFRRTGKWTLEAVEELISYFKSSEKVSFISLKEYLKTVRLLTQ